MKVDKGDRMQIRLTLTRQKHAEAMEVIAGVTKYWRSDFIAQAIVLLGKQEEKNGPKRKVNITETGVDDILG